MKLLWCDLETLGLRPSAGILEIALAEADLSDPFNIKHVYHAVLELPKSTVWQLDDRDGFVQKTHTANGLFAESVEKGLRLTRVIEDLYELIPAESNRSDMPVLAGSSVHFDHEFLKQHMPEIAARFSHRHYDVSAIKLFCQSLGMEKLPRAEAHRAVADIEESVAHAKLCAEWLKAWGHAKRQVEQLEALLDR